MRQARPAALLIILLAALVGPAQAATHRVVINGLFSYKPHEIPISGDGEFIARDHKCSTRGMPLAVRSITARGGAICSGARTVVRDWFHRLKTPGGNHCVVPDGGTNPAVCTVGSWRCSSDHTVDGHTYPVTCAHRRRRVHFVNLV